MGRARRLSTALAVAALLMATGGVTVLAAVGPGIAGSTWYADGTAGRSGAVGAQVRVYGVSAFQNLPYRLVLGTGGCAAEVAVLNPTTRFANASGFLSTTVGTIPPGTAPGAYAVCFLSALGTPSATGPAAFTVTPHPPEAYTVQPLYVVPSDGIDPGLAGDGTLARSVSAMRRWFTGQTGGPDLRWESGPAQTVRLPQTDAQIAGTGVFVRDRVEELLAAQGFDDSRKVYAVWYDGRSNTACGGGAWPPELVGHVGALYLQGAYDGVVCADDRFSGEGQTMEINEYKMLHEILHTLGFVPACAPHHTRRGHSSDSPTDLMWAGDGVSQPSVLDPGHDDYWRTGRTDCPDLADSIFLTPTPLRAQVPPGW